MKYYVYALIDPTKDNKVFYIGKGTGRRPVAHFGEAHLAGLEEDELDQGIVGADVDAILDEELQTTNQATKVAYIRSLQRDHQLGAKDIVRVIARGLSDAVAKTIESYLIKHGYGLNTLKNVKHGDHPERFRANADWVDHKVGVGKTSNEYVYVLRDPVGGEIFYVGKGTGDRYTQHFRAARDGCADEALGEKTERLKDLLQSHPEEEIARIVAHSLSTQEAFAIECLTLKFVVGRSGSNNIVRGHHSWRFRAKDDWEARQGFDLSVAVYNKRDRRIREDERQQMIGERLGDALDKVAAQFSELRFGPHVIADSGELARKADINTGESKNPYRLKLFIRSVGMQVECRHSDRELFDKKCEQMDYKNRRGEAVFLPDPWVDNTTSDVDEAARRVHLMAQWIESSSRQDLIQRVGEEQCMELLGVDTELRRRVSARIDNRNDTLRKKAEGVSLGPRAQTLEPQWLIRWNPASKISISEFFASRVVFYPGSGTDGQPVQFFGMRHAAHCFVYADYGITRDHIGQELGQTGHPFAGYKSAGHEELLEHDLTPNGWVPHINPPTAPSGPLAPMRPYAFVEILERLPGFDDTHGPQRLAILFLCADGVAAYDALFCQANATAPYAVVLQEHGFGGNWTKFGQGGALEKLASSIGRLPQFLLVAANTDVWGGYSAIDGATLGGGGMHGFERQLWKRI